MNYDKIFAENIGGKTADAGGTGQDASSDLSAREEKDLQRETLGVRFGDAGDGVADTDAPSVPDEKDQPSPTPRHDGWTPDVRVKFLEALANCGNIRSAVTFVQRSRSSAYNLKQRDMDFSRCWDAALLLSRDDATDVLQDRAINGIEEDVYHQGEVVGQRQRYDSRLLLAHIARLDKLAERISVTRGAARFGDMLDAIAAQEDTTALITEPTNEEIATIVSEAEAEATVQQVEAACLRQNNAAAAAEFAAEQEPSEDSWEAAEARHGPMHEIDWGDDKPVEYWRMPVAEAAELCAIHPQVKTRRVTQDDPDFVATIVTSGAITRAGMNSA